MAEISSTRRTRRWKNTESFTCVCDERTATILKAVASSALYWLKPASAIQGSRPFMNHSPMPNPWVALRTYPPACWRKVGAKRLPAVAGRPRKISAKCAQPGKGSPRFRELSLPQPGVKQSSGSPEAWDFFRSSTSLFTNIDRKVDVTNRWKDGRFRPSVPVDAAYRDRAAPGRGGDRQTESRKRSLSSANEAAPERPSNDPSSAMLRAAQMKAPHATRASAEPTEMRRTPRPASRATERAGLGAETSTLTGFGDTAFTIATISSGSPAWECVASQLA